MSKKGIWLEVPGKWTGWMGLATAKSFIPWTFGEEEIEMRLEKVRSAFPDAKVIEAREAPSELPWSEDEGRKAVA